MELKDINKNFYFLNNMYVIIDGEQNERLIYSVLNNKDLNLLNLYIRELIINLLPDKIEDNKKYLNQKENNIDLTKAIKFEYYNISKPFIYDCNFSNSTTLILISLLIYIIIFKKNKYEEFKNILRKNIIKYDNYFNYFQINTIYFKDNLFKDIYNIGLNVRLTFYNKNLLDIDIINIVLDDIFIFHTNNENYPIILKSKTINNEYIFKIIDKNNKYK